jgi:ADP-heptose:LPS heptosyltransferase
MSSAGWTNFYNTTRAARKVIVVDLGFLGDTVHLVPALGELRRAYAQAELHVVTTRVGAEMLALAPCVDRAWVFPLGAPSPPWWKHWGVLRALRRERFDVAINFSGSDRSVFTLAAIGARWTLTYQGGRRHFWQRWLAPEWIPRQTLPTPVFEGRRHLLSLCGFPLETARFDLVVPPTEQRWAEETVPAGALHLSVSASLPLKEWPLPNNVGLARWLLAQRPDCRLVATTAPNPREQARLAALGDAVHDERLRVMSAPLSISRLAALLQRCALHVGPDSGVLHLAAALDVPTVAIFRRYADMADWLPRGPQHAHLTAPCDCVNAQFAPCAAVGVARCLGGISAEAVGTTIFRLLGQSAETKATHAGRGAVSS